MVGPVAVTLLKLPLHARTAAASFSFLHFCIFRIRRVSAGRWKRKRKHGTVGLLIVVDPFTAYSLLYHGGCYRTYSVQYGSTFTFCCPTHYVPDTAFLHFTYLNRKYNKDQHARPFKHYITWDLLLVRDRFCFQRMRDLVRISRLKISAHGKLKSDPDGTSFVHLGQPFASRRGGP